MKITKILEYKKYWIEILLLSQIFFQLYMVLDYDLNSVKFLSRLVSLLFVALIVNSVCFSLFFLMYKKRLFKKPAALGLLLSNILIYVNLYHEKLSFVMNQWLGQKLINDMFQIRFVNVAVNDGSNLAWGIALGFYIGIGFLIYGQWFVKKKTDFENKIEKQLIYMGLGLYLFLFPFVFIFTHFTFVGSNYQYMQGIIKYTNSATQIYEKKNQIDNFEIKELKWFPDIKTAIEHYENPSFKKLVSTSRNKSEFYEDSMTRIKSIDKSGWYNKEIMQYDDMKRFHDWVQISYNFSLDGIDKKHKTLWYSEISPVLNGGNENDEDLLRHSVVYMHEGTNGVYVMIDFNRTFKDHKMNYIFNLFFVLYHLIYLGLFVYLIKIHSNERLGKKNV